MTTVLQAPAKGEGRPGYKHTKLGWIPEEWDAVPLDSVVASGKPIVYGIVQAGPHVDDGVPYIKSTDIKNGSIEPDALQRTSPAIAAKYKRSVVRPGDIVFSLRGDLPSTAVVPDKLPEANLTQGTARISVGKEYVNDFVQAALHAPLVARRINILAKGSTFQEISLTDLRKVEIAKPSTLFEQRRIAAVLGAWDRAIATVQQLLAAQQERKRGLMQELLTGRRRFKGFGGKWKKRSIGELIEESRIPVAQPNPERRITVRLHLGGVEQRQVRGTEATDATGYFHRKAGQFIYGKQNLHKGAMGIVPKELNGYESTQDIPAFDFLPGTHPAFFLYLMSRPGWYPQLEKFATGTGSKRLHPEELYQVSIRVPDTLEEQTAIAKAIGTLDAEIQATQAQLDHLTTQKRGLMQQLLTGAVRVKS